MEINQFLITLENNNLILNGYFDCFDYPVMVALHLQAPSQYLCTIRTKFLLSLETTDVLIAQIQKVTFQIQVLKPNCNIFRILATYPNWISSSSNNNLFMLAARIICLTLPQVQCQCHHTIQCTLRHHSSNFIIQSISNIKCM